MKRCIYTQSNYLVCDNYITKIDGECDYKTSNGGCIQGDYEYCLKCNKRMYFRDDKWHCLCGWTKGLR